MKLWEWLKVESALWTGRAKRFWNDTPEWKRPLRPLNETILAAERGSPARRRVLAAKEWVRDIAAWLYAQSFGWVLGSGWNVPAQDKYRFEPPEPEAKTGVTAGAEPPRSKAAKADDSTKHFALRIDKDGHPVVYRKEGWLAGVDLSSPDQLVNAMMFYRMFGGDRLLARVLEWQLGDGWRERVEAQQDWWNMLLDEHNAKRPGL